MKNNLYNGLKERLFYTLGKRPDKASLHDFYMALSYAVRDQMMTYWLSMEPPKDCGNIWFDSPHMHHAFEELRSYNGDFKKRTGSYHDYEFYAKEGVMLIFPSYVYHRVAPNESRQERISCSFNCNIQ